MTAPESKDHGQDSGPADQSIEASGPEADGGGSGSRGEGEGDGRESARDDWRAEGEARGATGGGSGSEGEDWDAEPDDRGTEGDSRGAKDSGWDDQGDGRDARADRLGVAGEGWSGTGGGSGDKGSGAAGGGRPRGWVKSRRQIERERQRRRRALRSGSVATASTFVFLVLVALVVTNAPGWERVRETFFDGEVFAAALPDVLAGFWNNVKIFLIAEPLILLTGLLIAMIRQLSAPIFFPLRALAVIYVDVFRGVPTLLIILLIGFGLPALELQGVPKDEITLAVIALTLSYSAYVAEVFRAGIETVHPSQQAAARSLGLSHGQAMRYVVLPQAVRRVVPPLLNDFVSLQKDTGLASTIGVIEAIRQAQIYAGRDFNYTPYLVAALMFILLTIPMARFTDLLAARARRRRGA
ncbi:amino acid ABC transporter permease [Spongiactinospora sp. 9N601]|uniref:amino acid ABC transporter permease n=1 Tax=Spongiactinospora sp. 9N601 TaxID=3375149 RepID=UPI00379DB4A2